MNLLYKQKDKLLYCYRKSIEIKINSFLEFGIYFIAKNINKKILLLKFYANDFAYDALNNKKEFAAFDIVFANNNSSTIILTYNQLYEILR